MLEPGIPETICRCADHKKLMPISAFDLNLKTGMPYSRCRECNAKKSVSNAKYKQGEAGKATAKRYKQGEAGKETAKRYKQGKAGKEATKRYGQGEAGKATHLKAMRKYDKTEKASLKKRRFRKSPKGKAMDRRQDQRPLRKIGKRLRMMLVKTYASATVSQVTCWKTDAAVKEHLESTFEDWMNWNNHGLYRRGDPYKTKWNIGHRIPCSAYDAKNPTDVLNCYDPANIFAQDSRENAEMSDTLPDASIIEGLLHIAPQSWNGLLPVERRSRFESGVSSSTS